jgi:hypothetical protein
MFNFRDLLTKSAIIVAKLAKIDENEILSDD